MRLIAVGLLLLGVLQQHLSFLPASTFLALLVVFFAVAAWRARNEWRSSRELGLAAALFLASFAITTASPVLVESLRSSTTILRAAAFAILPWLFFVLVLPARQGIIPGELTENEPVASGQKWLPPLMVAGAAFIVLACAQWYLRHEAYVFLDEGLYLLQGRLMREPGFVRTIDPSLAPFFLVRQTLIDGGRFYTHFPPGQPAILALFDAAGLLWWSGVIVSTAGVLFTYLVCRDLFSEWAGRVAAAMLVTNAYFVAYGTGYMPHGSDIALTMSAAWLTLRGSRTEGTRRVLHWFVAGLLLASLVTLRPLTGAAITLSIMSWQFLRLKDRWREAPVLALSFAAGSILPLTLLLAYNAVTNGSPLVFAYEKLHGSLHSLGFGERGWMLPGPDGVLTRVAHQFTPHDAVANTVIATGESVVLLFPTLLLAPALLLLCLRGGLRFRPALIAVFLVLPAVHFFYKAMHPRFYLELYPFFFVATAGMLWRIGTRDRALARVFLSAILLAQVLGAGFDIQPDTTYVNANEVFAAIRHAQAERGKILVFVKGEGLLSYASWFNIDSFPGDVIVARDLGDRDRILMDRFPQHFAYHADSTSGRLLTPLDRP